MIQQPPPYGAQQQVVAVQPVLTAVAVTNQTKPGAWGAMRATGIIQLVFGSLTIILGIAAVLMPFNFIFIGSPIWCGLLFYVFAGILGIVAGQTKNQCAAVAYMVLSIFACLSTTVVMSYRGRSIAWNCSVISYYGGGCYSPGKVAVDSLLVSLAFAEFIVSIVGASTTCGAVCCATPTQNVQYYQTQPQVVVAGQPPVGVITSFGQVPQQQQVAYQPQPAVPNASQGQFQPPPQAYQPPVPGLEQANAAPVDTKGEHLFQSSLTN